MKIKQFILFAILSLTFNAYSCENDSKIEELRRKMAESQLILSHKGPYDVSTVKQRLNLMVTIDQKARSLFAEDFNNSEMRQLLAEIDSFHTERMKTLLRETGWPTISKFGKEADRQAWLLVQHADKDLEFQKNCLSILKKLLPHKETNGKNYAFLYDRVAINEGSLQLYGTQATLEEGQIKLLPFKGNLDEMDKRRKALGLEPIKDYMKTLKSVYGINESAKEKK